MPPLDPSMIRHALEVAREHALTGVRIRSGDESFTATFGDEAVHEPDEPFADASEHPAMDSQRRTVTSPVVGLFSMLEEPVESGAMVKAGSVICAVVALGIPTDVTTPVDGTLLEYLVADGAPVEFGQPIAVVEASDD